MRVLLQLASRNGCDVAILGWPAAWLAQCCDIAMLECCGVAMLRCCVAMFRNVSLSSWLACSAVFGVMSLCFNMISLKLD